MISGPHWRAFFGTSSPITCSVSRRMLKCSLVTKREFSLHTNPTTSTGSVRVLYIGGEGRSGSTVLATILGSYPDIVTIGEFRLVWQALKRNLLCGCGTPVLACPFWSQVGDVAFGGWNSFDINKMMRADDRYVRHYYIPRHIALRSRRDSADLRDFRQALGRLYRAIGQVSGARIIVDSTKRASYAFVLHDVPEVDLRLVHLVRDSRGVAYSNTKADVVRPEFADDPDVTALHMPTQPYWRTALDWEVKNLLFYLIVDRSYRCRVTYEAFMANPAEQLNRILALVDAPRPGGHSWDSKERSYDSIAFHTLGGNPVRFRRGTVSLSADTDWQTKMTSRQKLLVSTLTLPLLLAYGYPIFDSHRRGEPRDSKPSTGSSSP